MIDFKPIKLEDRNTYKNHLFDGKERGCEFSFVNVYSWGHQKAALLHDHIVLLAHFYGRYFYPYPIGKGDKKPVLDAILADAAERGIPCCLTGLNEEDKQTLEDLYPGKFCFSFDRDSFDYVYAIDDLADLKGRKYHRKRNHFRRFQNAYPKYRVEPLTDETLPLAKQMIDTWYEGRLINNPEEDYDLERTALHVALRDYKELALEGLLLFHEEEIFAVTLGSQVTHDTFDVHFEKARWDIEGAYAAINCEFARYIRAKYPEIRYLNREEDMGIPGLKRAKESYFPHHQIEKYRAYPLEDLNLGTPHESQVYDLRTLWQKTFGDTDDFLDAFYSTAFSADRCRCITIGSKAAAALYWFDCQYENRRIAYIYAVAVAEAFRGQGFGRRLIEDVHTHLISLGYTGVILVPNGQRLFAFYEKFGYQTCSYVREFTIEGGIPLHTTANETEHFVSDRTVSVSSDKMSPAFALQKLTKEEFATLRRQFLPEHSVIQEQENLDFLETQAKFYAGEDFVMTAYVEEVTSTTETSLTEPTPKNDKFLHCVEFLGNTSHATEIIHIFGCTKAHFRTPGNEIPFAMYHSLTDDGPFPPNYFGLAFD